MFKQLSEYFIGDLIKDKNILEAAKTKIIYELVLFATGLTLLIAFYTYYLGHIAFSVRAIVSVFVMIGLLFMTKKLQSILPMIHVLVIITALSVLSNVFFIIQIVDYSSIALFFVNTLFCFYYLSTRTALFYSVVQGACLILVMYFNSIGYSWTSLEAVAITESEKALSFVIVLVLITYLLLKFHKANEQFSKHLSKSNEDLRMAKESADEMSRLKTHFLANMSHEIRTPLNGIIGLSELISDKSDSDEIREMADMQLQSSTRLLNTITSILKLSKMESEREKIELSRLELKEMITTSVDLLRPIAEKKKIELTVDLPKDPVYCFGTEDILYQILNNIAGNAIKFTDEGFVKVALQLDDQFAKITIADSGIGISEEFLPKIFNAFEQESSGINREYEGSGLGLSISKKYIEMLGGELGVTTEKGQGTVFTISLPLHY